MLRKYPRESIVYVSIILLICAMFDTHPILLAAARVERMEGIASAIRIAMTAMTISNSKTV